MKVEPLHVISDPLLKFWLETNFGNLVFIKFIILVFHQRCNCMEQPLTKGLERRSLPYSIRDPPVGVLAVLAVHRVLLYKLSRCLRTTAIQSPKYKIILNSNLFVEIWYIVYQENPSFKSLCMYMICVRWQWTFPLFMFHTSRCNYSF